MSGNLLQQHGRNVERHAKERPSVLDGLGNLVLKTKDAYSKPMDTSLTKKCQSGCQESRVVQFLGVGVFMAKDPAAPMLTPAI